MVKGIFGVLLIGYMFLLLFKTFKKHSEVLKDIKTLVDFSGALIGVTIRLTLEFGLIVAVCHYYF